MKTMKKKSNVYKIDVAFLFITFLITRDFSLVVIKLLPLYNFINTAYFTVT